MRGFKDDEKENQKKCCGTCQYLEYENIDSGWVCVNAASIYIAEFMGYDDYCSMWEERK